MLTRRELEELPDKIERATEAAVERYLSAEEFFESLERRKAAVIRESVRNAEVRIIS